MAKLLALLLLLAAPALAQETPASPIAKTQLLLHAPEVKAGQPIRAGVLFTLPEHWHIYWQNPGDSGIPTSLTWTLPKGVTAGDIQWPAPERIDTGGIINYGYSNRVVLPVTLTPSRDNIAGEMQVKVDWLVCKDICIPESATLSASLPHADPQAAALLANTFEQLPHPLNISGSYLIDHDRVILSLPAGALSKQLGTESTAQWFPIEDGVIRNSGEQRLSVEGSDLERDTLHIIGERGQAELPQLWHGILTIRTEASAAPQSFLIAAQQEGASAPSTSHAPRLPLLLAIGFAFLGGLILNLMPCVLPILSLKALALVKKSGASKRAARKEGIAYTAGVIVSFLIVAGLMLALKAAGMAVGWGFQLQEPPVVAALCLLMVLVALNLFGLFELPVLFGKLGGRDHKESGAFFTGVLAVALATPCTAPFMAPALGATLTLPLAATLLIFAALGFGMAFPFLLISLWPAARRVLPKPGSWMVRFRQLLGFPMLATAAWLLWVLLQITGGMGLMLTLGGAVVIAWLIWWAHGTPNRGVRPLLLIIAAATAIWVILMQPDPQGSTLEEGMTPYSAEQLDALRAQGKPVFVDATADWCLTCKLNEHVALRTQAIQQLMDERGVVLMIADWTARDDAITDYLASFGRNGVPLYVYYPPGGEPKLLPQILTPAIVRGAIEQP